MAKINSFDRNSVKNLRSEIDAALAALGKKYGVSISAGNASFTDEMVTFKLAANLINKGGEVVDKYAVEYNRRAKYRGMDGYSVGYEFQMQGKAYKLRGWKARAQKSPLIVEQVANGKLYRIEVETFKLYAK